MKPALYSSIKNLILNHKSTLNIESQMFEDAKHEPGKSTFHFEFCYFAEFEISNAEDIQFQNIHISFYGCVLNKISISKIKSENISISFGHCILYDCKINSPHLLNADINNCISTSLFLENLKKVSISYTESNLFPKVWQKVASIAEATSHIQLPQDLANYLLEKKQSIYIYNTKFINISTREVLENKRGKVRSIGGQGLFSHLYYLSYQEKLALKINIRIEYNETHEETKISGCYLKSLELYKTASGTLYIEDTKIDQFFIRDFKIEKEAQLYNISPLANLSSKVEIHKCILDNFWFDNIDFESYSVLSFYRSRFADANFTACNFSKKSLDFDSFKALPNIHYPNTKPKNYYKDQYEIFLQLKNSLKGSGNTYEAQKLNAICKHSLKKIPDLSKWDKFILWTNEVSNNYNLSITKPFFFLLLSTFIFYILYLISIGRIFIWTEDIDYQLFDYYFIFLDITHPRDFIVSKEKLSVGSHIIEFLHKIFAGYFIFQFVAAFRKYAK